MTIAQNGLVRNGGFTLAELQAMDSDAGTACALTINGQTEIIYLNRPWLPNESQMEQYLADELIEDEAIDIGDFMLAGLPETSYRPVGEAAEYGLGRGIDY